MEKVLIIGSGAREHALGWKIAQSPEVSDVFYAPGNAGTCEGKARNIPIDGTKNDNFSKLYDFVDSESIDMIVVGPEAPLAQGIVDNFYSKGFDRIFGPTKKASVLEYDKFFSYDIMDELGIPQAKSIKCYSNDDAINAINEIITDKGVVIKAKGLTSGKGVTLCDSIEQALSEINVHANKYGRELLIAERLYGQEFSVFGISDGKKVLPFEISFQDHKTVLDNDKGPNTGGMGAYGPAPIASAELVRNIVDNIMTPLIHRMKEKALEYKGFIYGGMIMTEQGIKVIEFNSRFGDPECQPAMMMLKSDLYSTLSSSLEGILDETKIELNPGAACCVVLVPQGYPGEHKTGDIISGLDDANNISGVKVFHAGTKKNNGDIITSGGRTLGVTGYSENGLIDAHKLAYKAVSKINIPGKFHYRNDIAKKAF
jgi:phosphoribosylamine---glycine ligase